jgi:hypothetical protein
VFSICGEHHGTQGVERSEPGCRGRRCRGRGCGAVEGIPGPRSQIERPATPRARHGHRHRTERVVARRGPTGASLPNPSRTPTAPDLARPGLLLAVGSDVEPALGYPGIPGRVPLASSTVRDLSLPFDALRRSGESSPSTTIGRPIAWRERHGGLLPLPSANLLREQGDRVFVHYGIRSRPGSSLRTERRFLTKRSVGRPAVERASGHYGHDP